MSRPFVYGPTFEEMRDPGRIAPGVCARAEAAYRENPLDPINLFNIHWKDERGRVRHIVLPRALTGVEASIVVLTGKDFPTGSHKVGATYSCCIEKQVSDEIVPGRDRLVWPSTGNYGIGGAYVAPRMNYASLVLLPEEMSQERFDRIQAYGSDYLKTPGCESNVKEIYDRCHALAKEPHTTIVNQFAEFGNYRFHYHVTGHAILELFQALRAEGRAARLAGFVSAMGSGGTIAAGDLLRQREPDARIVGLEPIQCPTLYANGFGGHDIQGIGDKHVTWIHNTDTMDALMCIDEWDCKKGLQLIAEPAGRNPLVRAGVPEADARRMADLFGISSICNILGAIKTAKFYRLTREDAVFTVATDALDRYPSVLARMNEKLGPMDETEAAVRLESIFHRAGLDYILEGTRHAHDCWANLKYFTWVEQQGKSVAELRRQRDPEYWLAEQARIPEIDRKIVERRGAQPRT
ncbi:MAG: pyridoxal-phosphate dependent enzyme [Candidatus Eisenbacteria bacterium]|nr:pyridoxal-phosphate dependent enzyme [Candidatus Eisenbacteria bacterium]